MIVCGWRVLIIAILALPAPIGRLPAQAEPVLDPATLGPRPAGTTGLLRLPLRPPSPSGPIRVTEETDRQSYLQRALKPHVDPRLQDKRVNGGGTGFFVSAHHILTAYHVVRRCTALSAEFGRDGETPAYVALTASDPVRDLAALEGEISTSSPVSFEENLARIDASDLSIIGYPAHGLGRQTPSIVSASAPADEIAVRNRLLRFFGDVHAGHSGSPLLDEYAGVIGLVTQAIDTVEVYRRSGRVVKDVGFAVPNAALLAFLDEHHIPHRLDESQESLAPAARIDRYRGAVVHIACWR